MLSVANVDYFTVHNQIDCLIRSFVFVYDDEKIVWYVHLVKGRDRLLKSTQNDRLSLHLPFLAI